MIPEDCENLYKNFDDDSGLFSYWCSAYQKEIGNCGEDCPKYKSKNHDINIKFKE